MLEQLVEYFKSWFASANLRPSLLPVDANWFQVDPWAVMLIVILAAAFLAVAINWGIRAHRQEILAGSEELIGKTAEVKTDMNPKGIVLIQGELWTAVLEAGQAEPGDDVVITKVDHLKVSVANIPPKP